MAFIALKFCGISCLFLSLLFVYGVVVGLRTGLLYFEGS